MVIPMQFQEKQSSQGPGPKFDANKTHKVLFRQGIVLGAGGMVVVNTAEWLQKTQNEFKEVPLYLDITQRSQLNHRHTQLTQHSFKTHPCAHTSSYST